MARGRRGVEGQGKRASGLLVEAVRLVFVAAFTGLGYEVGLEAGSERVLLYGVVLGSLVGFVVGGVGGRALARAAAEAEARAARIPAADMVAGVLGGLVGLAGGVLLGLPLIFLPFRVVGVSFAVLISLGAAWLGAGIGVAKREEILAALGVRLLPAEPREVVLDTSALVDGRVVEVFRSGFLPGRFVIPAAVLEELKAMADSEEEMRKARGRRGFEVLEALKGAGGSVRTDWREFPGIISVDGKALELARNLGAALVTTDSALARTAEAGGVRVLDISGLAASLRIPASPGTRLELLLVREGRSPGQAVGYLDDGTMVVVEGASGLIGERREVLVTGVSQSRGGRILFGRLAGVEGGSRGGAPRGQGPPGSGAAAAEEGAQGGEG